MAGFRKERSSWCTGTPLAGVDLAAMQFWKVEGEEGTSLMNDGDVETGMVDAGDLHPDMYPSR